MTGAPFKPLPEIDVPIDEIGERLDILYETSTASRAEIWTNLTAAMLRLAAPEHHDHIDEQLAAAFRAHTARKDERGDQAPLSSRPLQSWLPVDH
ncbi:hypothetical protein IB223_14055 [Pseudoxanthomonas sp. PXM03]|uniref:hypothetical protein n=1 Tax=Pseudoxanthomonas sp. PXM03 TaxID=2769284 RepID=UPI00177B8843|nr:hypothetical protein [Pseudoxanthomonas sp. PXM03]MBD9437223.1 hypothetical protein [Pseudoxanthomonas sp. PXM03]